MSRSDQQTLRSGLIGAGILASRAPSIHMAEARALGLDLAYDLFDFDKIVERCRGIPRKFWTGSEPKTIWVSVSPIR